MRWPIVTVTSLDSSGAGVDVLKANPIYTIESLPYPRRYYYFALLIKIGFEFNDNKSLLLTDNNEVNKYHLVDRLGNAVLASQAIGYSQSQRLMYCMYDDVKKIVRVLSPLAPTDYYIEGWLACLVFIIYNCSRTIVGRYRLFVFYDCRYLQTIRVCSFH